MRHRQKGPKLKRVRDVRDALLKNLVVSLVLHEQITTTKAKAKAAKALADHLIGLAVAKGASRRQRLIKKLGSRQAVTKMLKVLPGQLGQRRSGFVKQYQVGFQHGDHAPRVRLVLIKEKVSK